MDTQQNTNQDSVEPTELLAIIGRIEGLVDWHADTEADIEDPSPKDMHAHCNGLVLQACKEARLLLDNIKDQECKASTSSNCSNQGNPGL